MAKSFSDINTNFDLVDAITQDKKNIVKPDNSGAKKQKTEKPVKNENIIVIEAKEIKKRRATLLLKETVYNKIDSYAQKYNLSFNDLVSQILEKVQL